MIAIIDYDAGNLNSAYKALVHLGKEPVITREKDSILAADHIILPGVGAFGEAMKQLRAFGIPEVLREAVGRGIPLMGICLGMQLLFDDSEESPGASGLGIVQGSIVKIPAADGLKIPHMGWNSLEKQKESRLLDGLADGTEVYFVHSYYLEPGKEEIVAARTEYGTSMAVAVESGNVFGCQFHPEKSGSRGLKILENFVNA
ncbi:MAG: imidazole glycerol phosphate synthase subunit HisH [Lachnospiraceae bacterium]|nr:imidazole glycerol phosphate synthase subunit HisH [Lachnospiraceae bacterium]